LILDQSHEGYHVEWLFEWFHNSCNHYSINPKQIVYITGDMDVYRKYEQWSCDHNLTNKMCMVPYAHFENAVFTNDNNRTTIFKLSKLPNFSGYFINYQVFVKLFTANSSSSRNVCKTLHSIISFFSRMKRKSILLSKCSNHFRAIHKSW
jgi:hypothetical protein